MRTQEQYGPVTLSIIDQDGSGGLADFVNVFGSFLMAIDQDNEVQLTSKAGPDTFEIAVIVDHELVRPDSVGLDAFTELFEDRDHPVAGWIDQDTLDNIRNTLINLYGA